MPQGGLARRASAVQQLRAQAQGEVLLLDSGNSLYTVARPSATTDPSGGALPVEAMNAMHYDAMALGEMDLAASAEVVRARFGEAAFPILSANVGPAGALPNVQPYILRSLDGHRVAIIGVTGAIPAARLKTLGISLTVEDALEAVRRTVEEVRPQADVIILLSNLPRTENVKLAQQVAGLDVVIGAYGGETVKPQTVEGPEGSVILCAAGPQGKSLGWLSVQLDAQGRVVTFTGQFYSLTPQYANDAEMVRIMDKYGVKP
ncbi:MAG: hypothetical protein ACP5OO_07780 [Chloroflexia bacterium]